jgi:Mlc titration factor MtfA (ptsG expression regulator)
MISWLRNQRRRRWLSQRFPQEWVRHLTRNVHQYTNLSSDEQSRLRDDLRIFINEKYWEAVGGLELTDEIKVTIAAQACLLTLNLEEHDYFSRVRTILVYPQPFMTPHKRHGPGGVVSEGGINSGEAWFRGPVILSWADVLAGGRGVANGHNLVLHEFAHALDMLDGLINGTPVLNTGAQYARWHRVMTEEYQRLIARAQRGEPTLLNNYGASNVGEFFAVATECFFERGGWMRQLHPQLYDELKGYYRQDPASRSGANASIQ